MSPNHAEPTQQGYIIEPSYVMTKTSQVINDATKIITYYGSFIPGVCIVCALRHLVKVSEARGSYIMAPCRWQRK